MNIKNKLAAVIVPASAVVAAPAMATPTSLGAQFDASKDSVISGLTTGQGAMLAILLVVLAGGVIFKLIRR